tara:strand:+ start:271 stop:870 length:600 start_codon:yes stop_codon:yes gene_type:complete
MTTVTNKHEITRADIWPMARYQSERKALRQALVVKKKARRFEVGPVCTFYFENYETMWAQIHEMLFIEKGGEAQIADELCAYNPLVPQGDELVATVMFEIDEPDRRAALLGKLGGVEETAFFDLDGEKIPGRPEEDTDRTNAAGKASAVQFIHFRFSAAQIASFKDPSCRVVLGFDHPHYFHLAVLPAAVRALLAEDFD